MILTALQQYSFCLIRHGETIANRDGVIAGRLDVPLTDFGRDQARALQRAPWPVHYRLFCSPKERARETCHLAFPDQYVEQVNDLSERNWGIFEGQPIANSPARDGHPEKGEDWRDFLHRTGNALVHCCQAADNNLPIIVCHSGVIRASRILTGQTSTGSRPPNAKPLIFRWNGNRHIEEIYRP
ncbi:MAG TPA: histidine phosphatase family protein [Rhizobiales bacterium]|nr:histidine phosphatase family protein [Hyphomicrobiales bacterium]